MLGEEFSVRENFKDSPDFISLEASPFVASNSSLSIKACTLVLVFLLVISVINTEKE